MISPLKCGGRSKEVGVCAVRASHFTLYTKLLQCTYQHTTQLCTYPDLFCPPPIKVRVKVTWKFPKCSKTLFKYIYFDVNTLQLGNSYFYNLVVDYFLRFETPLLFYCHFLYIVTSIWVLVEIFIFTIFCAKKLFLSSNQNAGRVFYSQFYSFLV